ncbi:unnamed protein product [Ceratitis capitata]|uniref:(Mediterranean fruit fly) hypothetical protein n=1 Tax=Ceratitis capitata TaxID=7213 RepID=A0A811VHW3_CERCA|nr:unnamed protein product [Ceratitis capitata]
MPIAEPPKMQNTKVTSESTCLCCVSFKFVRTYAGMHVRSNTCAFEWVLTRCNAENADADANTDADDNNTVALYYLQMVMLPCRTPVLVEDIFIKVELKRTKPWRNKNKRIK